MAGTSAAVADVVDTIARSALDIGRGLVERRDVVDAENPSGEVQVEADVYADELLGERLAAIDGVAQYASEERAEITECGRDGVAVAVDPLDGTSNLPSNNPVGTIFAVYDAPLPAPGSALVGAGYVIFGPTPTMVVARDGTVSRYALSDGEPAVLTADYTLPGEPAVYGFGGRAERWHPAFRAYAEAVRSEVDHQHYCGSMIVDVNAVLLEGGVFAYPALADSPRGKLRLQFEGNPIGYIVESAGGRSSDGTTSLLAVEPESLHDRVPFHVGDPGLIDRLERALA